MREGLVAVRRLRPRSCAKRGWSLFVTPKIQPDVIPCLHHFAQFSLHNYSVCVIDSGVALIDWFPDLNSFSWVRIGRRFVSVPSDVSQHLQRLLWRLVWGKFSGSYVVNSHRKFFPQWECLFQPSSFHDDRLRYSPNSSQTRVPASPFPPQWQYGRHFWANSFITRVRSDVFNLQNPHYFRFHSEYGLSRSSKIFSSVRSSIWFLLLGLFLFTEPNE